MGIWLVVLPMSIIEDGYEFVGAVKTLKPHVVLSGEAQIAHLKVTAAMTIQSPQYAAIIFGDLVNCVCVPRRQIIVSLMVLVDRVGMSSKRLAS